MVFQKFTTTAPPSLIVTDYRYPKYKCTLQMLFSYLPRKILARIVGLIYDNGIFLFIYLFLVGFLGCLTTFSQTEEHIM